MNFLPINEAVANLAKKASGIYVIRKIESGEVVYVGESHSGRLRKTARRHFQRWNGPTAGPTYARTRHEIGFIKLRAENAVKAQNDLIVELRPRDNSAGKPEWL